MGEGGSRRLTDEESFLFVVNTSSTAIARTPKTHFIRFGEPRSGPPSPTGEGYSLLPLILHPFVQVYFLCYRKLRKNGSCRFALFGYKQSLDRQATSSGRCPLFFASIKKQLTKRWETCIIKATRILFFGGFIYEDQCSDRRRLR